MDQPILRQSPPRKDERAYTDRYTRSDFERYKEITQNLENFEKWKLGINPSTNRKIKIGGWTHLKMESEFTIYHGTSSFLFTKLDGINMELYMEETKTIKQATDAANAKVHAVIREIHALQRWDDYVAFEGSHYGIPPVHDKIHRENNCMGVVVEGRYESCRCHSCEDWGGCSNPTGTQHHACEKCGYQYKIERTYFNYKGK